MLIGRRVLVAGGAGVGVLTVAAVALVGKPQPEVLHPSAPEALRGMDAMVRASPAKPAPAIEFSDAAGTPHTLADYRGRGVVLNLWATWCGPCVAEMPSLLALSRAAEAFVVLPLSIDHGGAAVVGPWLAQHGASDFPVLLDSKQAAVAALGARGLPTTFVIDRAGMLRGTLEGGADWSTPAGQASVRALLA